MTRSTRILKRRKHSSQTTQRGISLIVGMIMLLLITIMSTTAFTLSTTNSKSVSNMQFRDEVIASGNKAIEQAIGTLLPTGFVTLPNATTIYPMDINNDGTVDYSISIAVPACIQSVLVVTTGASGGSSASLGSSFTGSGNYYNTMWDIAATVTDALSGASIEIHQGVRIALSETQKPLVCP